MMDDKIVKISFEFESNAEAETGKIDSSLRVVSKVADDASKALGALAGATVGLERDVSKLIVSVGEEEKKIANAVGKTADATEKAEVRLRDLSDASSALGKDIDAAFGHSAQSVAQLADKLGVLKRQQAELKTVIGDASKWGAVNKALTDEYNKLSFEIAETEKRLAGYGKTVNDARDRHTGMRTELRKTLEEMARMEAAGQRGSATYQRLQAEAGRLTDAMADVRAQASVLAHDQAALQGVISGLSGISAAASAAQGTMSLFAGENENLQKIMLKVQSLMAITIGLQQIQQTLNKDSAFRIKTLGDLKSWWTGIVAKAAAVETTEAAAMRAQTAAATQGAGAAAVNTAATAAQAAAATGATVANLGLAGAIRAVGLAIKSVPVWGWILMAIGAVVTSVAEWKKDAEEVSNQADELFKKVGENAGRPISQIEQLSSQWSRLGNNLRDKERFIKQNKQAFDELGVSIKNIADAENLLVNNKESFINAQIEKAKATAALSLTEDVYKQIAQKRAAIAGLKKNKPTVSLYIASGVGRTPETTNIENPVIALLEKDAKKLEESAKDYERVASEAMESYYSVLKKSGISAKQSDNAADSEDASAAKALEESLRMQADYERRLTAMQFEFERQQIAALNHSFYKQRKQIELNRRIDIAEAKAQGEELLAAKKKAYGEGATLDDGEKTIIEGSLKAATDLYHAEIDALNRDINAAFREGRLRFADELTVQLSDIENYYDERIRRAAGDEALIAQLRIDREKEVVLAKSRYSVEMMAMDIELTRRRIENAKGYYQFEADRKEALLKADKKVTEARLQELERQYAITPTAELASEIESARIELEQFNEALSRIPNEKMAETTGYFAQITGALGGLGGEIGQMFSSISSSMSSVSESFSRDTSTMQGKVGAIATAIEGTVTLINMVVDASKRRKEAEKEFYKNAIAFGHEYTLSLNEQLRTQSQSGAFIRDYTGEINDSFKALDMAMDKYYESLGKLNEGKAKVDLRNAVDWGATLKAAGTGAAIGASIGSLVGPIGAAIGAAAGAIIGGLVGIFGSKKKQNVTDELLAVFPELVDANGDLNREMAQTLINTEQVDEKTKRLLQNALDWADACEKAREQIGAIVEGLAGDVGNNLRNAIVGAWKSGEDASKAMFDVAGQSLENFITQLLYSAIFSDIFNDFRARLVDSLAPDTGDQDVLDDYDWLMQQMNERDGLYVELLNKIKERARQSGYATFGVDAEAEQSRQGSSKGIQSITQDSAEAIEGRLTWIVWYLENRRLSEGGINASLIEGVGLLAEIRNNTSHCERLVQIEKDIASAKSALEVIRDKGVMIKAL